MVPGVNLATVVIAAAGGAQQVGATFDPADPQVLLSFGGGAGGVDNKNKTKTRNDEYRNQTTKLEKSLPK